MKAASTGLATHLAGEVTTLATLWKVKRTDGAVFGFTDAALDMVYQGMTYSASTGHSPSSIKTSSGLNVDNLDIVSVLDSDTLTEQDIAAGKWDFAKVVLMQVNYMDLTQGHMTLRSGTLGQIRTVRGQFIAELRGMTQVLQQTMGDVYTPACKADLGDARCGIDLGAYTVTGAVTGVTDNRRFADAALSGASGTYDYGVVTWTSGKNDGLKMEVKIYTVGAVELQLAMPSPIEIGDAYTISAGCDKSRDTCHGRFANVVNFRGFPDLPGNDKVLSTA